MSPSASPRRLCHSGGFRVSCDTCMVAFRAAHGLPERGEAITLAPALSLVPAPRSGGRTFAIAA